MKTSIRNILFLLLLFVISLDASSQDNTIEKETYVFAIKDGDTLRLDKYDIKDSVEKKPCVIFVFGGGFKEGHRSSAHNVAYLQKLANSGYIAIGIDYRLGMRNVKDIKGINPELINRLTNSIYMAVDDLYDATNFVYNKAESWNIRKEQIIASGSSAGAVSVLQATYFICNASPLAQKLPAGFNYGGVIAFAGAIFSETGKPIWLSPPPPIQLFHGDADKNVPFSYIDVYKYGIYGSAFIADQLSEIQSPHYFYHVENAAHEIASTPMLQNLFEINSFINQFVIKKKKDIIYLKKRQIGISDINKNFTLEDYLQTNY